MDINLIQSKDAFSEHGGGITLDSLTTHRYDAQPYREHLAQFEAWWAEALNGHADNRAEMWKDHDYYDVEQWSPEDAKVLEDRGQAPLTFPIITMMVDWVAGTERRTRIDWDVLPREDDDVKGAQVKKEVLKFVSDQNGAGWERSRAFTDAAIVGVGWMEEYYRSDKFDFPVGLRHVDWKSMWWDPFSVRNDLKDCRYIHRPKWLDLDYATALFPDREQALRNQTVAMYGLEQEQMELDGTMPQMFYGRGSRIITHGSMINGLAIQGARQRVLVIETWYRKIKPTKTMVAYGEDDYHGKTYDPEDRDMAEAVSTGVVSLVDSVAEEVWVAFWTPGALLKVQKSPYKHGEFPFTAVWCKRRHRDGMPYGLVRPARDAQDEYNKRRSKILFDLSTQQVMYESDAVDEDSEETVLDEAHRSDGEMRLKPGALSSGKFVIRTNEAKANGQMEMLAEAKNNIFEASGVTRENTGQSVGDQSGRAILAKQQQGAVTTAALFDNYRQSIQISGQKTVSLTEQFMTLPQVIRISGPDGGLEWIKINQPKLDPVTGEVVFENDIARQQADFIVDQMDYRETIRMALAESLFELIGRLPGDVAVQLLDIAIDITDLPNKNELAARIRKINGQVALGKENSPEVKQAEEQKAKEAARQQGLQDASLNAEVNLKMARAGEAAARARQITVAGKRDAIDTASILSRVLPLAPAADRLFHGPAVQTTDAHKPQLPDMSETP